MPAPRPIALALLALACRGDKAPDSGAAPADSPPPAVDSDPATPADSAADTGDPKVKDLDVEGWSLQCVSLRDGDDWLAASADGAAFGFTAADAAGAARFFLQPADLATYLLYDQDRGYLAAEDGPLTRELALESDVTRVFDMVVDDAYISGAEWSLEPSERGGARYQLRSRRHDQLLAPDGLVDDASAAAALTLEPAEGCAEHPELSLDAAFLEGAPTQTTWEDGDLYGFVDTHSHILSNFAFGGGLFHGGPFHRLGVEHALGDCDLYHGEMGRRDFFGYAFDAGGNDAGDLMSVLADVLAGELSEDNHATDGYPTFSEWPDARNRATHQMQYHRWLERAWMAGLRLVVQHATSNSVICNVTVGEGYQASRYDCEDMTAVDRIIDETYAMERYIDARAGGAGQGWFRVVRTPAEARSVIEAGAMAVVLGIETSDLFDCHLTPRPGAPDCDPAFIEAQLDAYYERGVRALFPVHKYDNRFAPGDGSGDFIELGNFLNSGHWTNMTEDCPTDGMPSGFDGGGITFGGLQQPRDEYLSPAPNDHSGFPDDPIGLAASYLAEFLEPSISGTWCQNGTLTSEGEALFEGMMRRGMIIEVDHLPMWSYRRAYEILEENDYPAAGTHGRHWDGRIYALGGTSKIGFGRCRDSKRPGATLDELLGEVAVIEAAGGYPAVGFGFDLNGFAGAHGPRFTEGACGDEQTDPVTYPFTSYAGDVEFTAPYVGERAIDFGQEGCVHIGMVPELIDDARRDAASEADLEPLFRSAEAWIRMWEKAESRAAALGG